MMEAASLTCRAAVKRKVIFAISLFALLLSSGCLLYFHRGAPLPRIRFSDGGEFRVLQICYGTENDHHLGGAPGSLFSLWEHLPKQLQSIVPYPDVGVSGLSPFPNKPAISIWWAYIDPLTHKPEFGPTSGVVTTLDSGERLERISSHQAGEGYRQIFLNDPPRYSKRLHFQFATEDHPVEFSIENPAFEKLESKTRTRSSAQQELRYFAPVQIEVVSEPAENNGGLAIQVQLLESISVHKNVEQFEVEYSIVNLFSVDVFVATEPRDNVADSYSAFHGDETAKTGELRYSLLPRPNEADGKRVTYCAKRKAFMSLRNPLESSGRFHLCIYVEGYFRDTGQPFYGSTYVDLPVTILE